MPAVSDQARPFAVCQRYQIKATRSPYTLRCLLSQIITAVFTLSKTETADQNAAYLNPRAALVPIASMYLPRNEPKQCLRSRSPLRGRYIPQPPCMLLYPCCLLLQRQVHPPSPMHVAVPMLSPTSKAGTSPIPHACCCTHAVSYFKGRDHHPHVCCCTHAVSYFKGRDDRLRIIHC